MSDKPLPPEFQTLLDAYADALMRHYAGELSYAESCTRKAEARAALVEYVAPLIEDAGRYRYLREWTLKVRREETMGGRMRPFLTMQEMPLRWSAECGRGDAVDAAVDENRAAAEEAARSTPEAP